jgi:hypothetical protein
MDGKVELVNCMRCEQDQRGIDVVCCLCGTSTFTYEAGKAV